MSRRRNDLIHLIRRENSTRVVTYCRTTVRSEKGTYKPSEVTCPRCKENERTSSGMEE